MAWVTVTVQVADKNLHGEPPIDPVERIYFDPSGGSAWDASNYGGSAHILPVGVWDHQQAIAELRSGTITYANGVFTLQDVDVDDAELAAARAAGCVNVAIHPSG
jgi:hypothetical protein